MAANGKDEAGFYKDDGPIGVDHLHPNDSAENALQKIRTAGSVSIPPELFEKLYLTPENKVKGELRKTFGNPTPIGLTGFLLSLSPLSCDLMGWRGTGAQRGIATIGVYFFCGGIMMNVGGVMEWILGNTYVAVIFMSFGTFWLAYAATLQPFYNAYGAYSPNPDMPALGANEPGFVDAFAFFLVFMGLLDFVFVLCSVRTNVILFMILLALVPAFGFLAGAFWNLGLGNMELAMKLQTGGGACAFVACMFGWYLWASLLLAAVDAPLQLPVFDLSTKIKGYSERRRNKGDGPV